MVTIFKLQKPIFQNPNSIPHNKLCELNCKSQTAGEFLINNKELSGYNKFIAEIQKKTGEKLGTDSFGIYPQEKRMFDFFVEVEPNYRQQGIYLGEILRLKSIIELLENNFNKIELTSKDSAIFFHAKYKFEPNITSFVQRNSALKTIAQCQLKTIQDLKEKAEFFIESIKKRHLCAKEQRGLCKRTNSLSKEFIENILNTGNNEYRNNQFNFPMNMILTRETIIKNKDYFNKLFEKHGIDYNI